MQPIADQTRSAGLSAAKCGSPRSRNVSHCGKNGKYQGCRPTGRRGDRHRLGDVEQVGFGQRGDAEARMGGGRSGRLCAERRRAQPAPRQEQADRPGDRRHHQSVLLIDGAHDGERGDRGRLLDHRVHDRRRRQARARRACPASCPACRRHRPDAGRTRRRLCQAARRAQPAADRHRRQQGAGPGARLPRRRQPRRHAHADRNICFGSAIGGSP